MTAKDSKKGKCALYGLDCDLQESHILPKFAYRYLIETGSRYMRRIVEPSKRLQDGIKIPLLSKNAETEFSKRETYFKNEIFDYVVKVDEGSFKYDERLYYFIVSILWRVVQFIKQKGFHQLSLNEKRSVLNAEMVWREYLKGEVPPSKFNKVYLNISGKRIKDYNFDSGDIDYYMTRITDFTIIKNARGSYLAIYAKFGRFIFWSVLNGKGTHRLKKQRVDPLGGQILFPCELNESNIVGFIYNRIKGIERIGYNLSPKQEQKTLSEFQTNVDPDSDLIDSMLTDFEIQRRNRSK